MGTNVNEGVLTSANAVCGRLFDTSNLVSNLGTLTEQIISGSIPLSLEQFLLEYLYAT